MPDQKDATFKTQQHHCTNYIHKTTEMNTLSAASVFPGFSARNPAPTYKTKLKLDKEVGGGGGMSERTREPNERTGGTGALMSP